MAQLQNPAVMMRLHHVQQALVTAQHGSKATIVAQAAQELGVSQPTLHRWLQHVRTSATPHAAARKRRADAGQRAIGDAELQDISAALLSSYRRNGKRILSFDNAVQMLRDNGLISSDLTPARIATILTERGMHPSQVTRPDPSTEQRSLHPNHVWQVDASVCTAYYLSNATGLHVMNAEEFYKNKPANLTRIQFERLIRYAVADHYEHEILTRYYLGSECSAHLADFLIWAFAPKEGHPMHGVPFIVQMDMGSANTSAPVLNMLQRLQVRTIIHERHNSRANGSVEKAHHLVETHFESALRFDRVASLEDLNDKALTWANYFGATHQHRRYGLTRHEVWMRITADQLRLAPPVELMRTLPTSHPVERRVSNNLTIDFSVKGYGARDYDLRYLPGVMAGSKVQVVVNGLQAPAVEVQYADKETGELRWMTIEPTARDEAGWRLDAPIIGEQLRQAPRGLVDTNRDAALQRAFGGETVAAAEKAQERGDLAFGGKVDPWKTAREAKIPAYLPRRGTPLEAPGRAVEAPRVSTVAAAKRLREAMKRLGQGEAFGPHVFAWLQDKFGEAGVPEDQIDGLVAQFAAPPAKATDAQPAATGLRVVNGGAL
jgi:hypothetical protein